MASITPREFLDEIAVTCERSYLVETYVVLYIDMDILKVRVYVLGGYFIEVFYNQATDKVSFALIKNGNRIYGKDNAKMGWHVHPKGAPKRHVPCEPVTFSQFLSEVEEIFS